MLLILEFMQGGNLAAAIAADNKGSGPRRLSWGRQGLVIATGIALGLHYLHSKRVTHLSAFYDQLFTTHLFK
jgi:hypothetical protein